MRDEPSRTAEAVCLIRAADRLRPRSERILDDPYAEIFLGARSRAGLAAFRATGRLVRRFERRLPGVGAWVLARHRQIDDWMLAALREDAEQVVVLGAGYDARAYRFAETLAGRPVFELDWPATSERKQRIVARHARTLPEVRVEHVPIDFLSEKLGHKLLEAGFVPGAPTFVAWEGVSMYLTRAAVEETLGTLRRIAGLGSALAMDWWYLMDDPGVVGTIQRAGPAFFDLLGEPVTLSMHPDDVGAFFERNGYVLEEQVDGDRLRARYVPDDRALLPSVYLTFARTL